MIVEGLIGGNLVVVGCIVFLIMVAGHRFKSGYRFTLVHYGCLVGGLWGYYLSNSIIAGRDSVFTAFSFGASVARRGLAIGLL